MVGGGCRGGVVASVEDEVRLPQVPIYSPQWRKVLGGQSVKSFVTQENKTTNSARGPGLDPIPLERRSKHKVHRPLRCIHLLLPFCFFFCT